MDTMDWITDTVAIGNYLEAQDVQLIARSGFRSAISLDGTLAEASREELSLVEIGSYPLVDGPGNDPTLFLRALARLMQFSIEYPPVLVQCHAGRSRSVVLVAAYLMRTQGLDDAAALKAVSARRDVMLTDGIVQLLLYA